MYRFVASHNRPCTITQMTEVINMESTKFVVENFLLSINIYRLSIVDLHMFLRIGFTLTDGSLTSSKQLFQLSSWLK
jgi:hypothetical protein